MRTLGRTRGGELIVELLESELKPLRELIRSADVALGRKQGPTCLSFPKTLEELVGPMEPAGKVAPLLKSRGVQGFKGEMVMDEGALVKLGLLAKPAKKTSPARGLARAKRMAKAPRAKRVDGEKKPAARPTQADPTIKRDKICKACGKPFRDESRTNCRVFCGDGECREQTIARLAAKVEVQG